MERIRHKTGNTHGKVREDLQLPNRVREIASREGDCNYLPLGVSVYVVECGDGCGERRVEELVFDERSKIVEDDVCEQRGRDRQIMLTLI